MPVVFCIAAVNFLLVHLAPGDVAEVLAGQSGQASAQYVAELRHELGLDQPLYTQFLIYFGKLLSFNLGYSYVQQAPVLNLILDRLPATLLLMVSAIVLAIALGVLLGVTAARRHGSLIDNAISVGALIVFSAVTIGTIVTLTLFACFGGYQIQGQWLDRWGNVFTALVLFAIGVLVLTGII